MPSHRFRIGAAATRAGRWQAEYVRGVLAQAGLESEVSPVDASGAAAAEILLARLVVGGVDLAVHAVDDLPVDLPPGVELAAVAAREDPHDALIGRDAADWLELPYGAMIAARGLRRRGQLLAARPDLMVVPVDGPLSDRLARLDATPEWSGLVVTLANLLRLGLGDRVSDRLDPMLMVPAAGQGALGVTVAAADPALRAALRTRMHDAGTAAAIAAERAFVRALGGGFASPVAAHAVRDETNTRLRLHGRVVAPDGTAVAEAMRVSSVADDDEAAAARFGAAVADEARARGAQAILDRVAADQHR